MIWYFLSQPARLSTVILKCCSSPGGQSFSIAEERTAYRAESSSYLACINPSHERVGPSKFSNVPLT